MTSIASFRFAPSHRISWIAALSALVLFSGLGGHALAQEESAGVDANALPSVVAQFTTAVEDREPVDQVTFVSSDVRKIYLYSDLRGLQGQTVTHRWIYNGNTMAEVHFDVLGPKWRVWSSKDLLDTWVGDWTVEIVGGNGETLAAETFTYSAPGA